MADFVLKAKGESKYIAVSELNVILSWRSAVDLDLVAFYKSTEGSFGGVFSPSYPGGSFGSLTTHPFMELSGDALESDGEEASEEELKVAQLEGIDQLYIIALNQTDARAQRARSFSDYDISVQVKTSRGETFQVPLQESKAGHVALICRIDNSNRVVGPQLINEGRVMSLEELYQEVPGSNLLQVNSKLVLKAKESAVIERTSSHHPVHACLRWTAPVDLDLHCFYLTAGGLSASTQAPKRGFFARLFSSSSSSSSSNQVNHIYFGQRGSLRTPPYIELDHDAGIGDEGGDNEENIEIAQTTHLDALLFVANIYNKPDAVFGSYDGLVSVKSGASEVEAPLISRDRGAWAWIALVDCRAESLRVLSVNEVSQNRPTYADFVRLLNTHV
jgi:uncharacterized protein involved in tellurium resistance